LVPVARLHPQALKKSTMGHAENVKAAQMRRQQQPRSAAPPAKDLAQTSSAGPSSAGGTNKKRALFGRSVTRSFSRKSRTKSKGKVEEAERGQPQGKEPAFGAEAAVQTATRRTGHPGPSAHGATHSATPATHAASPEGEVTWGPDFDAEDERLQEASLAATGGRARGPAGTHNGFDAVQTVYAQMLTADPLHTHIDENGSPVYQGLHRSATPDGNP